MVWLLTAVVLVGLLAVLLWLGIRHDRRQVELDTHLRRSGQVVADGIDPMAAGVASNSGLPGMTASTSIRQQMKGTLAGQRTSGVVASWVLGLVCLGFGVLGAWSFFIIGGLVLAYAVFTTVERVRDHRSATRLAARPVTRRRPEG